MDSRVRLLTLRVSPLSRHDRRESLIRQTKTAQPSLRRLTPLRRPGQHTQTCNPPLECSHSHGQRNYHQQLLPCSERERLTCLQRSADPDSVRSKEIHTNMQRKTFLPFWVCPSSMSSSILLVLFYSNKIFLKKNGLQVQNLIIIIFLMGSPQSTSASLPSPVSLFLSLVSLLSAVVSVKRPSDARITGSLCCCP